MWLRVSGFRLIQVSSFKYFILCIEINIYDINQDDRVLIIASDGVWEFLSNEAVAQMAMKYYNDGLAE